MHTGGVVPKKKVFPVISFPLVFFNRFDGDIIEGVLETCCCAFIPVEDINDRRLCVHCGRYCILLPSVTLQLLPADGQ